MKFEEFLSQIPLLKQLPLMPEAHNDLLFSTRKEAFQKYNIPLDKYKSSAVVCLFYPKKEQTYIAFILRADTGKHASQIGFPGGGKEPQDPNLEATAKREVFEEIGIPTDDIHLIHALTEVLIPPSQYKIQPYIGYIDYTPNFVCQQSEVAAMIEVSFETLWSHRKPIDDWRTLYNGKREQVPTFLLGTTKIWGATAMILNEVLYMMHQLRKPTSHP